MGCAAFAPAAASAATSQPVVPCSAPCAPCCPLGLPSQPPCVAASRAARHPRARGSRGSRPPRGGVRDCRAHRHRLAHGAAHREPGGGSRGHRGDRRRGSSARCWPGAVKHWPGCCPPLASPVSLLLVCGTDMYESVSFYSGHSKHPLICRPATRPSAHCLSCPVLCDPYITTALPASCPAFLIYTAADAPVTPKQQPSCTARAGQERTSRGAPQQVL